MLHHSKLREEIIKWWPALLFWGRNIYSPWPTFRENICEFCSHKKSLSYIKMTFLLMKRLNLTFTSATVNSVKKDSEPFPRNSFFILMSFIFTKMSKFNLIKFDGGIWFCKATIESKYGFCEAIEKNSLMEMILWSIVGLQEKLHAICFLDSYVTFAFVFESMHGIKYFPVEPLIASA